MTSTSNMEKRLDEDFLVYLTHTEWCLTKLPGEWRKQAEKWLRCIIGRKPQTIAQKKVRNLHFSSLLLDMTFGELRGIYAESKPPRPDEPLPGYPMYSTPEETPDEQVPGREGELPIPAWVRALIEEEEEKKQPTMKEEPEMKHTSKDGRVYLATKALPNQSGALGFLSMATEERGRESGEGVRCKNISFCPDAMKSTPEKCPGRMDSDEYRSGHCARDAQTEASRLLAQRRPPEIRESLHRTYDKLLLQIERAMKGEVIPTVERMLSLMWDDLQMDPANDCLCDLPPYAIRDELLRRLLDTIVFKKGQVARREAFLRRMEQRVPPYCGVCPPEMPRRTSGRAPRPSGEASFYPASPRGPCPTFHAEGAGYDPATVAALKEMEADAKAEFDQKVKHLRNEIRLDLRSAKAENLRAKNALDIALGAKERIRDELNILNAGEKKINQLSQQLEGLKSDKERYSRAIQQGSQNLERTKRQTRDLITSRQTEIENLECQLRKKKQQLANVMKKCGEILGPHPESEYCTESEEAF